MEPIYVMAVLVLLTALATSTYIYAMHRRMRILEKRLEHVRNVLEKVVKQNKLVARAAMAALGSLEAEEFLRRLRAKRRRRYIAFYISYEGDEPPSPQEVERAIIKAVERLGGQLSIALGRVQLAYYDPERAAGVIRCTHDTKYIVLAALGIVRRIGKRKAVIIPVRTSGTIKRAKKALPS